MKGATSIPVMIVVTLILLAIIIAIAVLFMTQISTGSQNVFKQISEGLKTWICGSLPIIGGLICG